MEILKIDFKKDYSQQVEKVAKSFISGRLVAYPTDTVYGLGCIATDRKAISRIYEIKKRDKKKPVILLVKSYCMLKDYFQVSRAQDAYLRNVWVRKVSDLSHLEDLENKKAVTVILEKKQGKLKYLPSINNSQAVRLPKNDFLIKIIKKVNAPIISTSLNLSGERQVSEVSSLKKSFLKDIDLVVDRGVCKNDKPSEIIDIRDIKNIRIIRK